MKFSKLCNNNNRRKQKYKVWLIRLSRRKSTTSKEAVDIFFKDSIDNNLVCFFRRMITIKKHILGVICTSESTERV